MFLCSNIQEMKKGSNISGRVAWLDVARAFGIYAIYLGHFGETACTGHTVLYFSFMFHCSFF